MKYLKRFDESRDSIPLILNSFGIPTDKFRINEDGTVDVLGNVKFHFPHVPFKFGNIDGKLEIINNQIVDWSFMPDTAKKYRISKGIIENKFWKKYYELVTWEIDQYEEFQENGYNSSQDKLLSDYYLEMAANHSLLKEYSEAVDKFVWEDAKGEFFNISNLSIQNYPFFTEYEDVDFVEIVQAAKENDHLAGHVLIGIMLNDDGFYRKEFEKIYLDNIYDQIRTIGIDQVLKYNSQEVTKLCSLVNMNLQKDERTNKRDQESDCYVFIASYGFREKEDGNYEKFLDIENLFKVDIYDPATYQTINMMKLRARSNSKSTLYMIWLPKDFFPSERERIQPNEYQLKIIDKYKEQI